MLLTPGRRVSDLALRAALLLALTACNGDEGDSDPGTFRCLDLPRPPSNDLIRLEPIFKNVSVEGGVDLLQVPGDPSRWYLVTQPGQIYGFEASGGAPKLVLDFSAEVVVGGESGLLGMAFHPDFASNGEVFLSYNAPGGAVFVSRISRMRSRDGGLTLDPSTEEVVLEVDQPYSNHNGGDLAFGPDGHLYFGLGDGGSGGDPQGNAQNLDSLLGKILRLDVDGGDPYAIPADNPFADGGGRPEIYAWGLRNPWRLGFDSATGDLWAGDVGQNVWEEVDRIERGKNYGWNIKEGPDCFGQDSCDDADLVDPLAAYRNIRSASVIAGVVYRGEDIPQIVGRQIYTDFYGSTIYGVDAAGDSIVLGESGVRGLVSFAEGADGEVYALDYQGGIYRLAPAEPSTGPALPERLSATGCIDPTDFKKPPADAIAYEINHPFWSDGADKQRWMMLPPGAEIGVGEAGDLDLPIGSVVVKSFHLGDIPVETRLLVRHDDGAWAGYSYAWDAASGEATLLSAGETREIAGQSWIFPGRDECLYCHTEAAGHTLGLEAAQLARDITGPDGLSVDQLDDWARRGLLPTRPDAAPLPALDDDTADDDARVRAYFHVNCSQCHRPEAPGGRARIDFRVGTPLAAVGICDASPRSGDLDIADARLVAPGDPAHSLVSARMHTLGSTRMPGIGSARIDEVGVALVDAWISALTACP